MKIYRINCMDENDEIVSTQDFTCRDDLAALDKANLLCKDHGIEVWDSERRVVWMRKGGAARFGLSPLRPDNAAILAAIAPPNPKSVRRELAKLEAAQD